MTKKRMVLIVVSILILLSLFFTYWFYFSKPTAFPTNKQLATRINTLFPKANAETIQDTIELDSEHAFVPFISGEDNYGTSYWVWEKHKWKPSYIDTVGEPVVWKTDKDDPASFHIVWNIHPDDQISRANFYLIRDRGYHISSGEHTYVPQIQMEKNVRFEGKSYGTIQLPDDWCSFMTQSNKLALAQNPNRYNSSLIQDLSVYIGWMPLNDSNETTFPENSVNGSGFSNGDNHINFMRILDKSELEK
ncbi:hypothetical protein [Virgibacillus oceani]|uniref:Uncharacterized protein n=1 Tax=Virgibacillus oceani TaxID=1479511 RepID=A0A917M5Z3_9BACI|nr:hypothetical protein [Virgibacillus oceani]GGG81149.1 hypothetical protein GCM10011398_28190 [Virgibacillus oceani]